MASSAVAVAAVASAAVVMVTAGPEPAGTVPAGTGTAGAPAQRGAATQRESAPQAAGSAASATSARPPFVPAAPGLATTADRLAGAAGRTGATANVTAASGPARTPGDADGRIGAQPLIFKSEFMADQDGRIALEARHAAAARRARRAEARAAARRTAAARQTVQAMRPARSSGSPQRIAMAMLGSYGWPAGQFGCLNDLWSRESGWNPAAENTDGAFGIPQALPGSKMASAGADWQTNPATQIRWGLGYIRELYGSPCGAWDHELATGSY
jgi:hypothetical protein